MRSWKRKIGIIVLILIFSFSNNLQAQQPAAIPDALPEGAQPVSIQPGTPGGQKSVPTVPLTEGLNPYNLIVPEKFGSIEEIFQGAPGTPLVIHIQDAHANYEAQLNIKRILKHLSKSYNINLIQLEGASSKLNPAIFETAYLKQANYKLADYMMREGRLSGAEAFAIEADQPVVLEGVENRALYMENLRTFRSVYSHQEEIKDFFKSARVLAKDLRIKLLNEELLDLTRNMEAYAKESIDLLDYLLYLNKLSERHKLASLKSLTEIGRFPNLVRIIRLNGLEKELNEGALKREADTLKKEFYRVTKAPEVKELLASLELKKKGMKPRVYFRKLTALAEKHGVELLAYPQLRVMSEFLILQDEIEHHGLFDEVHRLEKLTQKRLLKKREERKLIELLRSIDLLEQYFKLEVNREKLAYIVKRYEKLRPSHIRSELDALARQSQVMPSDYTGDVLALDKYMEDVEYFYRVVLERDRLFVENVLAKTKESKADRTVLITGGFHTDGLTTLLRKQNVSYLVVIPKVDVKQNSEKYVKIMMEQDSEIGSVFAGSFALQLVLNTGNPVEHIGPAAPYVTLLRLAGHLGAGLAVYEAALRERAAPDLAQQREAAQRFAALQPFIRVNPVEASFNADEESVRVVQTDRIILDGKVIETTFEITVNADGFDIKPIGRREIRGNEARADLQDLNLLRRDSAEAEAFNDLPSIPEVLAQTIAQREARKSPSAVNTEIIPFPGILVADPNLPRQILSALARIQDIPYAMRLLSEALKTGQTDAQVLNQMIALSIAAPRAVTAEDIDRAVDESRQERIKAFLAMMEKPAVNVMVMPILEEASLESNASQVLSLAETMRMNPGAGSVVAGRDAEAFVRSVLKGADEKLLSRIRYIEVAEGKDVLEEMVRKMQNKAYQAYQVSGKTLIPGLNPQTLLTKGYVRVLLPDNEAGKTVSESLRQDYLMQGVVQLRSALERKNVAASNRLGRAFADIQVKVLNLLPDREESAKDPNHTLFFERLDKAGLRSIVVAGKDGWEIGTGIEALVAELFTDFLAAREIAIRA
ncbi:MAG: hypothetical protein HY714_06015 [Candidatus Omnitrophica bacterium]|nr:hypothetical protein [Candidatus Omnitrophota bacterium]